MGDIVSSINVCENGLTQNYTIQKNHLSFPIPLSVMRLAGTMILLFCQQLVNVGAGEMIHG